VVVYGRVAAELAVVAPALLRHAAPIGAFALVMLIPAAVVFLRVRRQQVEMPEQENPARLRVALTFAALYGLSIFAAAAAQDYFGDEAIYLVALVSGLTQVDAMTLSVAQLYNRGELEPDIAWRAIYLATLANLAFKIGAATVLGSGRLRAHVLTLGGGALAAGVGILLLWP
jgi:uncharacterized membrane protein (DUF4010 family)